MSDGIKNTLEEIQSTFEEFKASHTAELAEIKAKGSADVLVEEKTNRINAEISKLTAQVAELEKKAGRPAADADQTDEHSKLFVEWARKGRGEDELSAMEAKSMSRTGDSGNDGGHAVPAVIDMQIVDKLTDTSVVRSLSRVVPVGTANYSFLVNQRGTASGWVAEDADRPETASPKITKVAVPMGELYANIGVTQQALDDIAFNVEGFLTDEIAAEFASKEGDAFLNGTGTNQPRGILHASSGVTNTADVARSYDAVIDLIHGIKAGYRSGLSLLADTLEVAELRKLKNENGNYLWQPSLITGQPATLGGYAIYEDDNMPANTLLGGNFRHYRIADRIGINVLRDPYSNKPYVMFYAVKRVGAVVEIAEAFRAVTFATA